MPDHARNRDQAPARDQARQRLDVAIEPVIVLAQRHVLADQRVDALQFGRGRERLHGVHGMRRREQLDAEHRGGVRADASSLRPAHGAMLTWSSWPAEVGRLSTEAGCARVLFSETSAAAVTCAIMKPDSRPGLGGEEHVEVRVHAAVEQVDAPLGDAREFGDRDREEVADEADRLGVEVAAREDVVAEDQRIVGHAVDARRRAPARACSSVCSTAPNTCGMQRTA